MPQKRLFKSFVHAARGIAVVWKEEKNFRLQTGIAVLVFILMYFFSLSKIEKSILALLIILVFTLEMLNSIFERFVDVFRPRLHDYLKDIKDIAAGLVLLSSLGALFVGIIIFFPYFYQFIAALGSR